MINKNGFTAWLANCNRTMPSLTYQSFAIPENYTGELPDNITCIDFYMSDDFNGKLPKKYKMY